MDYVVRPLPSVTLKLADQPRIIQDRFQEVGALLAMNPYPNPQVPLLTEDRAVDGTKVYTYSDPVHPFIIQYLVFEATDELYGVVSVIDFIPVPRRRRT